MPALGVSSDPGSLSTPEAEIEMATGAQLASPRSSSDPGSLSDPEADIDMAEAGSMVDSELEGSHESGPKDSAGQTTAAEQNPSAAAAASDGTGDNVAQHNQDSAEARYQEVLPKQQDGEGETIAAEQDGSHLLDHLAGEQLDPGIRHAGVHLRMLQEEL